MVSSITGGGVQDKKTLKIDIIVIIYRGGSRIYKGGGGGGGLTQGTDLLGTDVRM